MVTPAADRIAILLVEDEPDLRTTLKYNLRRAGYEVADAHDGQAALELAQRPDVRVDLVISDVMMPRLDGFGLARALRALPAHTETPLLFLTARAEATDRAEGFRVGADDYVTKPFDVEALLARVKVQARRAMVARRLRDQLPKAGSTGTDAGDLYARVAEWERRFPALAAVRRDSIVGSSPRTLALLRDVLLRAPGKDPVLIVGETGTGKTGVAEALWRLGPRADKPFRVVNCAELAAADAAITMGKLFGYGKMSGLNNIPREGQPGLLEDLDGGTLFLDEIHQLPLAAQAMLLLPVEGRAFNPAVGKGAERKVDVKFIVATNVDLRERAAAGNFPSDLYQRLAGSLIRVPSLSERPEDISVLAEHFLEECRTEFDLPDAVFVPSVIRHFTQRAWPGNVRQLRGVVREMAAPVVPVPTAPVVSAQPPSAVDEDARTWDDQELPRLQVLRAHGFRVGDAETALGLSSKSRTLTNQLRAMCFKAMALRAFKLEEAAALLAGPEHPALVYRLVERMQGYLNMVDQHVGAHTPDMLFNNTSRMYRRYIEDAIARSRDAAGSKP
jgi:DNA-binding NtrC family response regulator